MDGITILKETIVHNPTLTDLIIAISAISFIIVIAIGIVLIHMKYEKRYLRIIAVSFCIALELFVCIFLPYHHVTHTHTEYTVTIDDTVGFNEFMETYEIVSQNGNEYVVKERTK